MLRKTDIRSFRALGKGFLMLLVLFGVAYGLKLSGLHDMFDTAWIDANVRGKGLHGQLMFLCMAGALTAVGFPRQIVSFLGGYAYGVLLGTVLGVAGTTIGCVISFFWARLMGQKYITRKYGHKLTRFNNLLNNNVFSTTLIIRFMPVGSNVVTNILAGVTTVSAFSFIFGSLLGYVPQTLIFALLGSGVHVDPVWRTVLSIGLFVLSGVLGVFLYRRNKNKNVMNGDESDTDIDPSDADELA